VGAAAGFLFNVLSSCINYCINYYVRLYAYSQLEISIAALLELGTIAKGAALLHQEGAREVYACSTHAVFR